MIPAHASLSVAEVERLVRRPGCGFGPGGNYSRCDAHGGAAKCAVECQSHAADRRREIDPRFLGPQPWDLTP